MSPPRAKPIAALTLPATQAREPKLIVLPNAAGDGRDLIYEKLCVAAGGTADVFIGAVRHRLADASTHIEPLARAVKKMRLCATAQPTPGGWKPLVEHDGDSESRRALMPPELVAAEVLRLGEVGPTEDNHVLWLSNLRGDKETIASTLRWGNLRHLCDALAPEAKTPACIDALIWRLTGDLMRHLEQFESLGLVHSDIKPLNIVLAGDDKRGRLIDLGGTGSVGALSSMSTRCYMPREGRGGEAFILHPSLDIFMSALSMLELTLNLGRALLPQQMPAEVASALPKASDAWWTLGRLVPLEVLERELTDQSASYTSASIGNHRAYDYIVQGLRRYQGSGVLRSGLYNLLINMCHPDAARRPSATRVLRHLELLAPDSEHIEAVDDALMALGPLCPAYQEHNDALIARIGREAPQLDNPLFFLGHKGAGLDAQATLHTEAIAAFFGTTQRERRAGLKMKFAPDAPWDLNQAAIDKESGLDHVMQHLWQYDGDLSAAIHHAVALALDNKQGDKARLLLAYGMRPQLQAPLRTSQLVRLLHDERLLDVAEVMIRTHVLESPDEAARLLRHAIALQDPGLIDALIASGANLARVSSENQRDLLYSAVMANHAYAIEQLIACGAPLVDGSSHSTAPIARAQDKTARGAARTLFDAMPAWLRSTHLGTALATGHVEAATAWLSTPSALSRSPAFMRLVRTYVLASATPALQAALKPVLADVQGAQTADDTVAVKNLLKELDGARRAAARGPSAAQTPWMRRWAGLQPERLARMCPLPEDAELDSLDHEMRLTLGEARVELNLGNYERALELLDPDSTHPAALMLRAFALLGAKQREVLGQLTMVGRDQTGWSEGQIRQWHFVRAVWAAWEADTYASEQPERVTRLRQIATQQASLLIRGPKPFGNLPLRLYLLNNDAAKAQPDAAVRTQLISAWDLRPNDEVQLVEGRWMIAGRNGAFVPLGLFT